MSQVCKIKFKQLVVVFFFCLFMDWDKCCFYKLNFVDFGHGKTTKQTSVKLVVSNLILIS